VPLPLHDELFHVLNGEEDSVPNLLKKRYTVVGSVVIDERSHPMLVAVVVILPVHVVRTMVSRLITIVGVATQHILPHRAGGGLAAR
jgi:hypothetical protein